eukprot:TRINITY_DN17546_c0_g1_i1.p1 TRINITY_DN17546_c0_g1~~TRINITY_DN17546_c0_g1_i1.p1  ORF type:complete len:350 (-),score=100.51 TRINITY_DN17546_c0_g1_i1:759-1808(-)
MLRRTESGSSSRGRSQSPSEDHIEEREARLYGAADALRSLLVRQRRPEGKAGERDVVQEAAVLDPRAVGGYTPSQPQVGQRRASFQAEHHWYNLPSSSNTPRPRPAASSSSSSQQSAQLAFRCEVARMQEALSTAAAGLKRALDAVKAVDETEVELLASEGISADWRDNLVEKLTGLKEKQRHVLKLEVEAAELLAHEAELQLHNQATRKDRDIWRATHETAPKSAGQARKTLRSPGGSKGSKDAADAGGSDHVVLLGDTKPLSASLAIETSLQSEAAVPSKSPSLRGAFGPSPEVLQLLHCLAATTAVHHDLVLPPDVQTRGSPEQKLVAKFLEEMAACDHMLETATP